MRFLQSKAMLRLRQNDLGALCTVKLTQTGTLVPQLQWHLRFTGHNLEGSLDMLDVDFLPTSICFARPCRFTE
jgi:hypothetical protein